MTLSANKISALKQKAIDLITAQQYRSALPLLESLYQEKSEQLFVFNSLGITHKQLKHFDKALEFYKLALELAPEEASIYTNMGNLYRDTQQFALSIEHHQKALSLEPNNAAILTNLASSLSDTGKCNDALDLLNKAIEIAADYADARFNRAIILLRNGDFKRGLADYESRWDINEKPKRYFNLDKPWQGEDLKGKRLVIYREQGFGDVLQFIRYAPLLKQQGATLYLLCQDELVNLLKTMNCFERIVTNQQDLPEFDYAAPILSLPYHFHTALETIPNNTPYLTGDFSASVLPKELISKKDKIKIGFCWAGKPTQDRNAFRSCSLDYFKPLFKTPNTEWFSLQLGEAKKDLTKTKLPNNVFDVAPFMRDFLCSAAIVNKLDLIISIDTAIVHLAGALNKPVWNLIDTVCDWRWLLDRDDSPWYSSVTLFRQKNLFDWKNVFDQVATALTKYSTP